MPNDALLLTVNDIAFFSMPYQADIIPNGPQNIDQGWIELNGEKVNDGFIQYFDFVDRVFDQNREPTTDIDIGDFKCSSSEVLNSMFDVLGRTIDTEQGLKKLMISHFYDQNVLQEWPLTQLIPKSTKL